MIILIIITVISLLLSFIFDRNKTMSGIKKGILLFLKVLPTLLSVIIIISLVLFLTPDDLLMNYLGYKAGISAYIFAAFIGSISLMPGFIAYPLAGILVKNGVSYPVIAVFITTLMMVGVLTIPLERKYFGLKVTLVRNALNFIGALIVGGWIGVFWSLL
ncbi:hypothetical protein D9V86_07060 [Bacteroidetes/Chlorobi group bacterium ChocPot_Mid]|jgi:uncharacterized membrane protein YraQ (UPF0718 family)|nr:MAG: hypothetical protein D9V86_07060 [Bacteroidetes/Chlorobi group bacterium ChocPot_Mid]